MKFAARELSKALAADGAFLLGTDCWQLNALAAESGWVLGIDATTMFRVERLRLEAPQSELARTTRATQARCVPAAATITGEPPDLPTEIARVVHPGLPGAVVRLSAEILGTSLMLAYPWSPEHGWSASN